MSEHDHMCPQKPCYCRVIRLVRHDTMNTAYYLIDSEAKKAYDMGDPTIAVALWNARSMVSELATKRWPKTN